MEHTNRVAATATPVPDDEGFGPEGPARLLEAGKTLMKAGTPFVTAITVQKARDLDKIVKAIDREAEYAGDAFYYGWTDKKGNRIEGPSIGLANSLAREWTNCAVTVDFQETAETFIITPRFIDIEKGFQMERVFRQRKNVVQGNFDPDRKLDMALQIGQSKGIRNVVVNAVPRWLVDRAIEKAKAAVVKGLDPNKIQEYADQVMSYFTSKGATPEQVIAKAGKPKAEWSMLDIASFKGDKKALENGEVSIGELFPSTEPKAPAGPIDAKTVIDGLDKAKAGESEALVSTDLDQSPSAEEQAEIKRREIWESKAFKCTKCPQYKFGTDSKEEMDVHGQKEHPAAPQKPADKKTNGGSKPAGGGLFGT